MNVSRRKFLKLAGAIVASGVPIPALAARREPYVMVGDRVDSIIWHLWDDPRNPAPCGPLWVHEILPWDGKGFPIVLVKYGWRVEDRRFFSGFYDFEWSNLWRDVPDKFWHSAKNRRRYPNIHAYVREQRFGEHPHVMRKRMAANAAGRLA